MVLLLLALAGCKADDVSLGDSGQRTSPPAQSGAVATAQDGDELGWLDLQYGPDGRLWVSWVQRSTDGISVWASVSSDGVDFSEPIRVDAGGLPPYLATARRPYLEVSADRVAVIVGVGTYVQSEIHVYLADVDDPVFEPAVIVAEGSSEGNGVDFVDQPEGAFSPDGELWVAWKVTVADHVFRMWMAKESDGYLPREVLNFPGMPCECCPHQLFFEDTGELFLALRANENNLREIYVGRMAPGSSTFDPVVQASHTGWEVAGCPFDGPTVAAVGPDQWAVTWIDATSGDAEARSARSTDNGLTWSGDEVVWPGLGWSQRYPTMVSAGGRLFHAVEEIAHETRLATSDDLGLTWEALTLDVDGAPLFDVELTAHGDDQIAVAGTTEGGAELWVLPVGEAGAEAP